MYTMYRTPLRLLRNTTIYDWLFRSEKLSWTPQIHSICNKANRFLGFLYRNLHHCPPHLKERTYKRIVLPSIEYCSAVWASCGIYKPWRRNHRNSIIDMLSSLIWPPLKKQRRHQHLILLFKFLNGLIHIPSQYLPAPSPSSITTIRSSCNSMQEQNVITTLSCHGQFQIGTI